MSNVTVSANGCVVVNVTPHLIRFFDSKQIADAWKEAGEPEVFDGVEVFPASGVVLNAVETKETTAGLHMGKKRFAAVKFHNYDKIIGWDAYCKLAKTVEIDAVIASTITAQEWPWSDDFGHVDAVLVPDTSTEYGIRNSKGQPVGTTRWIVYPATGSLNESLTIGNI